MALDNTDGEDDAGIARYFRTSFAIAGNCVLCILHHSKGSNYKEAMTSTDLIPESRSQAQWRRNVLKIIKYPADVSTKGRGGER